MLMMGLESDWNAEDTALDVSQLTGVSQLAMSKRSPDEDGPDEDGTDELKKRRSSLRTRRPTNKKNKKTTCL